MRLNVSHQPALFATTERILAQTDDAEIRYIPAVFSDTEATAFFAQLRDRIAWEQTTMWMYDHEVTVPRLTAWWGEDAPPAWPLEIQSRVEQRLGVRFNSVGLNFYRDGNDSVAWHADHNEDLIDDPTVAIVSFGETREMLVRPNAPPRRATACQLETGSLLVMSGRAQDRFEHHIPKCKTAVGQRISVVFRTKRGSEQASRAAVDPIREASPPQL
jgi:alkylated DNA repair dioxygenase AlkB